MSKRKWLWITGVLTMFLLITGCSKSTPDTNVQQDQTSQGTESKGDNPPATTKLESDTDLTQQLEAEKGIDKVMIQVVEGEQPAVNVDITINNEQELSVDQVIEKYSQIIKDKYPNRPIDIIVIKEGKQLKQATIK
ncbi:hypothetical protein [Desulfosporosinus hippei]|uniref:Sporulation lipoprotein YhcN/YlaJ (Spore_YhcN_YlaJ) n=1 Tax=Desulfosporosinus hippei DSM 8344 TaxID=1121419 RepID=A0A1G8HHB7_9FIRM|nr:hypothetical protein [Desulfosporosinus hippei]SDI06077.1 hypothetical protein SAMN05443529_12548 [Desulfosporosinus hippei DSM 8344]